MMVFLCGSMSMCGVSVLLILGFSGVVVLSGWVVLESEHAKGFAIASFIAGRRVQLIAESA